MKLLILSLLYLTIIQIDALNCPKSYPNELKSNGKCIYRSKFGLNFLQAAVHCRKMGGKLFEPTNDVENEEVKKMMPNTYYWIGLEDLAEEGK